MTDDTPRGHPPGHPQIHIKTGAIRNGDYSCLPIEHAGIRVFHDSNRDELIIEPTDEDEDEEGVPDTYSAKDALTRYSVDTAAYTTARSDSSDTSDDEVDSGIPDAIDGDPVVGVIDSTYPDETYDYVRVSIPPKDSDVFYRYGPTVHCPVDNSDNPQPGTVRSHWHDTGPNPLAVANTPDEEDDD